MIRADRVKETTTTTGTGTVNLAGPSTGFQGFVAGVGNGNVCQYCIFAGSEWEVGIGTVTDAAPDTLSRTTVLASSNAGALVNFSAGTKDVFLTLPAKRVSPFPDDSPPTVPTAYDDEFESETLNTKWTEVGSPHVSFTKFASKFDSWWGMEGTGNATFRYTIRQALTGFVAGTAFQATIKCSLSWKKSPSSSPHIYFGVGDNTSFVVGNYTLWGIIINGNEVQFEEYNGLVNLAELTGALRAGYTFYLHMQRDTGNTMRYYGSADGITFTMLGSAARAFSLDYLFLNLDGSNAAANPSRCMVDWVRVNDSRFTQQV